MRYTENGDYFSKSIYARDNRTCQYCGDKQATGYVMEHVIPDGPTEPYNIVVACRSCNVRKGATTWIPNNLDIITAEYPSWRARIIAQGTAPKLSAPPKVLSRGVNADFALLDACKLLAVKQRRKLKDVFNEACRDILHKYGEPIPDTDGDA